MSRSSRSTFASAVAAAALLLAARSAEAQACCAGSGAVTPARLGVHEDALIGMQLRGAYHLGSHDATGGYVATPSHARELDLEQNVFAAIRVLRRAQLSVLVPFVETYRRSSGRSSMGGGIGDVNVAARHDLILAGEARVPGIGLLAGVTLPTGTPAESAKNALATDATGIGAVQANAGIAIEQSFGAWFASVSALFSYRAPRDVRNTRMLLAPQYTALASAGYAFESGATVAAMVSYSIEGNATANGVTVASSARRVIVVTLAGAVPISDQLRVVASVFSNPPIDSLGLNQPTTVGLTLGVIGAYL